MLVRVRVAPAEGAANAALLRLLAKELDVPQSAIVLERGAAGRNKLVSVTGVDAKGIGGRWPGLNVDGSATARRRAQPGR